MERVLKFLKENAITTVATSLADKPRASVMEYIMVGDSMMFATNGHSIKAKNLSKNNRISLSVHSMPVFLTIDGVVVEPTAAEQEEYNALLIKKHPEFMEMMTLGVMSPFVYFKVVMKEVHYNDYRAGMSPTEIITV